MPLHPKAKEFAKSGLFAGVKSFAEKALGNAALLASPSSMPFAVQTEKSEGQQIRGCLIGDP
jgi:hypothetical protein